MGYAQNTSVSETQSRVEIERLIRKYVGRDASFSYGSIPGKAAIQFGAYGRQIKFELPLPNREEGTTKAGRHYRGSQVCKPTESQVAQWLEQEDRRRWRCMLLIIKAKFAAVEMKLELCETDEDRAHVFEQEFLSAIVTKSGATIYEAIREASVGGQRLLPAVEANVIEIKEARK